MRHSATGLVSGNATGRPGHRSWLLGGPSLAPGLRADLVILNLAGALSSLSIMQNPIWSMRPKGADVRTVIIDGQVVMRDREVCLFDQTEVLAKVREITKGL